MLEDRYGMQKQQPKVISKLILPHSKAEVDLVYHDFLSQVKSLLIDPRINDEDYLFFNNDPFGPPPSHFLTISDINTGLLIGSGTVQPKLFSAARATQGGALIFVVFINLTSCGTICTCGEKEQIKPRWTTAVM